MVKLRAIHIYMSVCVCSLHMQISLSILLERVYNSINPLKLMERQQQAANNKKKNQVIRLNTFMRICMRCKCMATTNQLHKKSCTTTIKAANNDSSSRIKNSISVIQYLQL